MENTEHVDTIVIGGGQSGLAMGYHLRRRGVPFVILDANERVGHAWRRRWDSLRLFTPARYSSLPGMRIQSARGLAPTKDDMADYLEAYAARFELPIRPSTRVESLTRDGDGTFVVVCGGGERLTAANVVVATGADSTPWTPPFAPRLDARIVQLPSYDYRNRSQLAPGGVLLVGAGNSGADIAIDLAPSHPVWLSGRHPGHVPFRIENSPTRHLVHVVRFAGHHVFRRTNPIGRKVIPKLMANGSPLVRVKPQDLVAAGVERVPRVAGTRDGLPLLEDDRTLNVTNVIWCTGYRPSYRWIDLPVFTTDGHPDHTRGVVGGAPGLYFLGLDFQYAATSAVITGVGRDAAYLAKRIAARDRTAGARGERVAAVASRR